MMFFTRMAARLIGIVFIALGVAGFFTRGYVYDMKVNFELSLLHIFIGILGLASARVYVYAKHWLTLFGIGIFALGVYSIFRGTDGGTLTTNATGNSFYLLIGGVMFLLPIFQQKKN
jgi:Domain of unknown function (DUF4383)